MKFGLKNISTKMLLNIGAGTFAAVMLTACGGGGGSPGVTVGTGTGTGTLSATKGKMTVTLIDQNGNPANLVSGAAALSARAKVVDSTGKPVVGAVVKFTAVDTTLVGVSPASDLTDANGDAIATITSASPSAAGATTVSAESAFDDAANPGTQISLSGSANLKVGVAAQAEPSTIELVSYMPADKSILIKSSVGTGRSQTAQVTFKVTGNGQPIANQKVKFEFQPANADLTFASNSGVTGQGGEVTAIVNSGATVTVAAVKVTVLDASGNPTLIVATSDQISVTNDTTSIAGISLSADKFFFEAFQFAGDEVAIVARLTDKQGGQVTNGTVVTFTTDGGAITGLNNSAMCQTKDGACSVKLVGQNPRPASGIATVIASVRVDGVIQTTPIRIVMSGSLATFDGEFVDVVMTSCDPQTITFNVSDARGNPMPEESKLTILTSQNATAKIIGDTVKYAFVLSGGTTHQMEITPGANCVAGGAIMVNGSITILLTTPNGFESTQVVTLNYQAN
ncbi:MAG: Ig-like domain-containing protein [Burkholderiaceae bacterium]